MCLFFSKVWHNIVVYAKYFFWDYWSYLVPHELYLAGNCTASQCGSLSHPITYIAIDQPLPNNFFYFLPSRAVRSVRLPMIFSLCHAKNIYKPTPPPYIYIYINFREREREEKQDKPWRGMVHQHHHHQAGVRVIRREQNWERDREELLPPGSSMDSGNMVVTSFHHALISIKSSVNSPRRLVGLLSLMAPPTAIRYLKFKFLTGLHLHVINLHYFLDFASCAPKGN